MLLLGLLVAVCFVPGYLGASIPTQWAVFSCVLPLSLWRVGAISPLHWAGLAALAWSAISITWAPNTYDAIFGLWLFSLWALAFWLGSTMTNFAPLWKGLALGLTVSSAIAITQAFGLRLVESTGDTGYAGLLFNPTVLGATSALVLIALWTHRLWWWMPGLIPGLYLANSRAAYVVLALTFTARYLPWPITIILLALGAIAFGWVPNGSDTTRLTIWSVALPFLNILGNGVGSFTSLLYHHGGHIFLPERAHNDYLQLWFELGIGAIAIYAIYAIALLQRHSREWPIFVGFAILGLFYFPLWAPITAFIGCTVAGRLTSDWYHNRLLRDFRGYALLPRHPHQQPATLIPGGQAIPVLPAT